MVDAAARKVRDIGAKLAAQSNQIISDGRPRLMQALDSMQRASYKSAAGTTRERAIDALPCQNT